jgi:uncharacterized protein
MSGKRILLVLGGLWHDFDGFRDYFVPILTEAGHTVDATYDLDTLIRPELAGYDLVMVYTSLSEHREGRNDTNPETLSPAQTASLAAYVRAGGGLLAVHGATVSGQPNPAMRALMGALFVSHPPQFAWTVYPMHQPHPITEGAEAFTVHDEFYVQDVTADIAVHMVALDRGVAHPMVWTRAEGQGRVAGIAMGHGPLVWGLAPYQRLLHQAIAWVARTR